MTTKTTRPAPTGRIVVIGAGYAGLCAAARAGRSTRVTLIAPEERIPNRIRQHEVAAGRTVPKPLIADVLRGRQVTHVQARVTELDLAGRKVFTDTGRAVPYDTLVYAIGSRTAWHEVPGAPERAYGMERAGELRERLAASGTGRVAVVGGGATGIELAAELAEAYPGLRVQLVCMGEVGGRFSAKGRAIVLEAFARLGVELHEHRRVTAVDESGLTTDQGRIEADVVAWAGSFEVSPLAKEAGLAVTETGEVVVDTYLRSVSHPEVYAIGDAAAVTLPGVGRLRKACATAEPMGVYLGKALRRSAQGKGEAEPFEYGYTVHCLSLGRHAGMVQRVGKDDSMRERAYGGRVGKSIKALIVWGVVAMLRF
ncbi:FAD-dependent oxidoreductase [Actinospica durhamensis]|uniref:FAD-dependent oxidoreductase n=1 Tax=Actinospica durhamensis TaxID=1508375 RepID=A0A941ELB8_9ACTN|nr:FAD-dependent oxidoreductase [Actinospica durhamensis]MBR7832642.1 FAD-dependent oxidoreductase [Actinospica durhamensis]